MTPPETASVIVLAGGAGTRIRHLYPGLPKPLIPVAGRPFLDWVCAYWVKQGVRNIVVSLGHLAEAAERHLLTYSWPGVTVRAVREEHPLGTGGAARFAAADSADPLVVVNGDSLVFCDLSGVWRMLSEADGILLSVRVADAGRYGTLRIGPGNTLLGFEEKRPGAAWINAGVYFIRRHVLDRFPERSPLSMEVDVFPALIANGARLHVYPTDGEFLDIGTPEGLAAASAFIQRHSTEFTP
jgi:D-glycero-alpha-D-manno-heptose 1-phosphate guanylyltransferase